MRSLSCTTVMCCPNLWWPFGWWCVVVWWPLGGVSTVVGPCGLWGSLWDGGVLVGCGGPCTSRRHKLPCLNSGTQSPTAASPRTCCRPRRARDPSSWGESCRGEGVRVMIVGKSWRASCYTGHWRYSLMLRKKFSVRQFLGNLVHWGLSWKYEMKILNTKLFTVKNRIKFPQLWRGTFHLKQWHSYEMQSLLTLYCRVFGALTFKIVSF